jgi:hypothetical protein
MPNQVSLDAAFCNLSHTSVHVTEYGSVLLDRFRKLVAPGIFRRSQYLYPDGEQHSLRRICAFVLGILRSLVRVTGIAAQTYIDGPSVPPCFS